MKLVDFSIKRRVTVSMAVLVIIILGFISLSRLGLDMFPDMEMPYVSVVTTYAGVSSEDIEQNLTRPLEQWVSTISNVNEIKSISQEGVSVIMVEFESGTNLDFAAQDIRDTLGLYENYLPQGAKKPLVFKFNFADFPILMYGITGGQRDLKELKEYIDNEVATRLERIDGVASAIVFSSEFPEILVNIDKGKLESRGLTIAQVEGAIQASNINLPSGFLDVNHKEYLIRTIGEFVALDDIARVVIGAGRMGEPIFLRDIAEIKETAKDIRNRVRINGDRGVMMIVTKSPGSNTVLVSREIKKTLAAIAPTLDKDLEFNIGWDMSDFIEIMASRNIDNILFGSLLAMVLILLFLRNLRPTLAIGLAIPLSVITTFIALYLADYTLNMVTLAGLALGIGMLVDNSIVVIENIFRHLEEGASPLEAARKGASEVGMAITASTFTTIVVFFPMMFASGMAGKFANGLALTVAFSLLPSLIIALTIVPMLASWFFKVKKEKEIKWFRFKFKSGDEQATRMRNFYEKYLHLALARRKLVFWSVFGVFILAVVVASFMGSEFMPAEDRSMVYLKVRMPVGTNVEETDRIIKYIEEQSLENKNVLSTMVSAGVSEQNAQDSASSFNPAGSYEATLMAFLKTSSQRDVSDQEIIEQWRQYFPELENGKIEFMDLSSMMSGTTSNSPIEFNFFGRELKQLENIAESVKQRISNIQGIRDIAVSLEKSKPEVQLVIKKEEAARLGLTPYDISRQVQTYTIGTVVSRTILGGEERDIRVRLRQQDRDSIEAIKKLPILTPRGGKTYLSQVVDFKPAFGAVKIERENQVKKVSVTANFVDRNLSGIVKDIMEETKTITANLPEGYFFEMGGQYKDMIESFLTMFLALLLSVVLVYAVMASQFENLKYPFIIMFTIPLDFIGVVFLLAITGSTISLITFMGFIILGGIVVNNGIVMVDYINQLIATGMDKYQAVVKGAVTRLRPILLTALTTMIGMLPMALSTSEGASTRAPLALTLIGGLLSSTFLTLFVVPILYSFFAKIKTTSQGKKKQKK